MKIRGEEHRALRDILPADVREGAVKLNVASRERGGESLITPAKVKQLGEQGVRSVVKDSFGDPSRAARLIATRGAERLVRGSETERER